MSGSGYAGGEVPDKDGHMMREKYTGKVYSIVVRRELSERYASAFEGMRMETEEGVTILTGEVKDQPHLFGILERINGLGLELLRVEALPEGARSFA
jgi:hypothetical protein